MMVRSPELFKQFLPTIKSATDAIINITTGGGLGMTFEQRLAPAKWAKPEIASMNMGSFNFNISGREFKDFRVEVRLGASLSRKH